MVPLWAELFSMNSWFMRVAAEMGAPYLSVIGGGRREILGVPFPSSIRIWPSKDCSCGFAAHPPSQVVATQHASQTICVVLSKGSKRANILALLEAL